MMSYENATVLAQIGGMFIFGTLFIVVMVYAFWPRNKDKFDHAAAIPIGDESLED